MNSVGPDKPAFPDEFDPIFYRSEYKELSDHSAKSLKDHFALYGVPEGRSGNAIKERSDLLALIPDAAKVLEIGPYYSPVLRGENIKYFDVLTRKQMIARARKQGNKDKVDPPEIDYVSPTGDLSTVQDSFDFVVSSYCIEHQPDLIKHLQDVEQVLRPGGCYIIMAPDKRYCHDHFMHESTIAEVIEAHHEHRTTHPLRSAVEHVAMSAHNDHFRHWNGDHGKKMKDFARRLRAAMRAHKKAAGGYLDVHSWYFTPQSMRELIGALNKVGYLGLKCVRCYHTRKYHNDFWVILQK